MKRTKVAILLSGRGSNAKALIEAAAAEDYPARIVGILSDRPDAGGIAMARAAGIPATFVERLKGEAKADHEGRVETVLNEWQAEIVCLAGYMRVLSAEFVERWMGRLLNIHPSLLPAFPGLDTHGRALARGVALHGCTVHLVTEGIDEGPILAQATVPVLPDDDVETLAARVLVREHELYPHALADCATGRTRLLPDGTIARSADATFLI